MSERLLESDFLTVSLNSILRGQKPTNNTTMNNATTDDQQSTNSKDSQETSQNNLAQKRSPGFDWGEELKRRLTANEKMHPEARKTEYEIEKAFWIEFFNTGWAPAVAKALLQMGEQLRKDIKNFDFKKETNPILAFISLKYVQNELIQTKLLNANTYKSIHQAFVRKLVADTEFFEARDYNILYCRDLYRKPAGEIVKYLEYQNDADLLSAKKTVYFSATQWRNRKVFLAAGQNTEKDEQRRIEKQLALPKAEVMSVKDPKAQLNSINFVEDILSAIHRTAKQRSMDEKNIPTTVSKEVSDYTDKLKTPEQIQAVLQYISMTTGNSKATEALLDKRLSGVSMSALMTATSQVSGFVSKLNWSKVDVNAFVKALLAKLG